MRLFLFTKLYVAIALIAAAVLSPPAFSFVPVILLIWYLYQWRWPVSAMVDLLTQYFIFFALAVLYSVFIHPLLAPLISLPVLLLILNALEKSAPKIIFQQTDRKRIPTRIPISLLCIAVLALFLGWVLNSPALELPAGMITIFFIVLGVFILARFPVKPIEEESVQQRILAGKEEQIRAKVKIRSRLGGLILVQSDQDWIKVKTGVMPLKGSALPLEVSVTPVLSGPSAVNLKGYAIDRWGFFQNRFDLEPVKLLIIPRATYAAWLAKKYMAGSKPGTLLMVSDVFAINSHHGLRQGIEFYGNRLYQPGDSLKTIDWNHSSKYNELIIKEFTEFQGQPAILLINLVAGDAEAADKLAYNIIASALTLARENIPTALAVYDNEKVVLTTGTLSPTQLVGNSLQLLKEIRIVAASKKYLNPPDVLWLRTNINRISRSKSKAAGVLEELLRLEYNVINENAKANPCTLALFEVNLKVSAQSNLVTVSDLNHDTEAISVNSYLQSQKGNIVINIR